MPDYNVYIHAIGTGNGQSNPTVPWSQRESGDGTSQTSSQSGGGGVGIARAIIRASSYAQNPDSVISQSLSNVAKAFPIVAAAYAVIKVGESIIDNAIEFVEIETGDYRNGVAWKNFKTNMNIVLHPASSSLQAFKIERQWSRENQRARLSRDLLGDSVINSYTNRGV